MKKSASFQLTLRNYSLFCRMEDRTVDFEDVINVEDLVIDENLSERSTMKFFTSTTLPRSEVVIFFQANTLLILIISCLIELTCSEVSYEEMPFWVSVLSAAVR